MDYRSPRFADGIAPDNPLYDIYGFDNICNRNGPYMEMLESRDRSEQFLRPQTPNGNRYPEYKSELIKRGREVYSPLELDNFTNSCNSIYSKLFRTKEIIPDQLSTPQSSYRYCKSKYECEQITNGRELRSCMKLGVNIAEGRFKQNINLKVTMDDPFYSCNSRYLEMLKRREITSDKISTPQISYRSREAECKSEQMKNEREVRFPVELGCINRAERTTEQNKNLRAKTCNQRNKEDRLSIECGVCLELIKSSDMTSTICGHVFCRSCITRTLESTRKCPLCNRKLTRNEIHSLYLRQSV